MIEIKCRLCDDRDETIHHVISERSKLAGKKDYTPLGGKGDPLEIVQEIKIWPHYPLVQPQTRICPGEWDADFGIQTDHLISAKRPNSVIII